MADPLAQTLAQLTPARAEVVRAHAPLGPSDNLRADDALLEEPQPTRDEPAQVLVVDDDPAVREVLTAILREEGYAVTQADSAEQALAELSNQGAARLPIVLSDLKMPEHDGQWLLDQVLKRHPMAAVVMLTGYGDTENAVECLKRGACDYLLKPPRITELVRSIERAASRRRLAVARARYQEGLERRVEEKTAQLSRALAGIGEAYQHTLAALVAALDAREHETSDHSQRVVRYTLAIADKMGLRGVELEDIGRGALLHDIGKIGVPDGILLKPGPLTPSEWAEMRRHPEIGWQILQSISFLAIPAEIVLSHQERWDGLGYPRGLKGEQIHLGARVFAIADTLDAMTSDRPYRRASSYADSRAEIARCSGTQFDPAAVRAFLTLDDSALAELRRQR
jgi:putative nucleotidyltransferase with HDIG domain